MSRQEPMLRGESIPAFAARFGLTWEELLATNPEKRPPNDRIYLGQKLWVPDDAVDTTLNKENKHE